MTPQDAAEATIRVWTDPDTNRDLIELEALAALAEGMGLCADRAELLGAVMSCGGEVLMSGIEQPDGSVSERVLVRMPEGWKQLVAGVGPKL